MIPDEVCGCRGLRSLTKECWDTFGLWWSHCQLRWRWSLCRKPRMFRTTTIQKGAFWSSFVVWSQKHPFGGAGRTSRLVSASIYTVAPTRWMGCKEVGYPSPRLSYCWYPSLWAWYLCALIELDVHYIKMIYGYFCAHTLLGTSSTNWLGRQAPKIQFEASLPK